MDVLEQNKADANYDKSLFKQPIYDEAKGTYSHPWEGFTLPGFNVFVAMLKYKLTKPHPVPDETTLNNEHPVLKPNFDLIKSPVNEGEIRTTWIGHASLLIQIAGFNFLTDPIFSERCSPFTFLGPKRFRAVPLTIEQLPPIDFVLISHNHFDHLDLFTVQQIGNEALWYVPKGLKQWFTASNITNCEELTWWQETKFNKNVDGKNISLTIASCPCQHWSKRTINDTFKSLWCSWAVMSGDTKFYFGGDTGYCPAFKQIGDKYGPFTLAAIPIGAYEPREVLKCQHVDPEEAVQVHIDIKAKNSVGIHWGTFVLTGEHVLEPPKKLKEAAEKKKIPVDSFFALNIGETRVVK